MLPRARLRAVLAVWLRRALELRGVSTVKLHAASEISRQTISDILNENVHADDETIETLAQVLDVAPPAIALVGGVRPAPAAETTRFVDALVAGLSSSDPPLAAQVAEELERGTLDANLVAALIRRATQMLAARVADLLKTTLERNEIGGSRQDRLFVAQFLRGVAREFRAYGAEVSDILLYADELEHGDPRNTRT